MKSTLDELKHNYEKIYYGEKQFYHIFSPYRICPLGAHVDHQHGLVSGFAFNKGVDLLFTINENPLIEINSLNFNGKTIFSLKDEMTKKNHWSDYPKGVIYALKKRFKLQFGINAVINGTLPIGGLSSSAAVMVAYAMALTKANNIQLTQKEIIKVTSEAEREFIGLNNGILDQACVVLSEKDHLLYLDTETNDYQLIPKSIKMPEFEIGVIFSGITRSLVSTDYNLRVDECKAATWYIQALVQHPIQQFNTSILRNVSEDDFEYAKNLIPERFSKRAQHFFQECNRVKQGVNAWQKGDLKSFGELIFDSCESSVNNYECGSRELIEIYHIMRETEGIYGGRFSGAGFKGACVCLIDPSKKEQIETNIRENYLSKFPKLKDSFEIHFCKSDSRARFIDIN